MGVDVAMGRLGNDLGRQVHRNMSVVPPRSWKTPALPTSSFVAPSTIGRFPCFAQCAVAASTGSVTRGDALVRTEIGLAGHGKGIRAGGDDAGCRGARDKRGSGAASRC